MHFTVHTRGVHSYQCNHTANQQCPGPATAQKNVVTAIHMVTVTTGVSTVHISVRSLAAQHMVISAVGAKKWVTSRQYAGSRQLNDNPPQQLKLNKKTT